MIIIARRVGAELTQSVGVEHIGKFVKVGREELLLVGRAATERGAAQAVEAHILIAALALFVHETCVALLHGWHAAPRGLVVGCGVGRIGCRQAVLVTFTAVFQHIFRNVTEVEVELAARVERVFLDKRVHHPKLKILNVRRLEVLGCGLAHNAAPLVLRVYEAAAAVVVIGAVVVRSALGWVEGYIEGSQVDSIARRLVAVGVNVEFGHAVGVQARLLGLRHGRTGLEHQRVNLVPRNLGAVVPRPQIVEHRGLAENVALRNAGQCPRLAVGHIVTRLTALEIIDIHLARLAHGAAVVARLQLRKLALNRHCRFLFGLNQRQPIQKFRK